MEKEHRIWFCFAGCLVFWSCFLARQDVSPQVVEKIIEVKAEKFKTTANHYNTTTLDSQFCFIFCGFHSDTLWTAVTLGEALLVRTVDLIVATPAETERQVYKIELYDILLGGEEDTAAYTYENRNKPEAVLIFKAGDARRRQRQKLTERMALVELNKFMDGNMVGILVTRMPQFMEDRNGKSYFFQVNLHIVVKKTE